MMLSVVGLFIMVGGATGVVYLPCDVGDCSGRIQPGWIDIGGCRPYENIGDSDIDVEVILEGGPNDMGFDSTESGDSEAATEVVLNVLMSEAAGETVTVDYVATGGSPFIALCQ